VFPDPSRREVFFSICLQQLICLSTIQAQTENAQAQHPELATAYLQPCHFHFWKLPGVCWLHNDVWGFWPS